MPNKANSSRPASRRRRRFAAGYIHTNTVQAYLDGSAVQNNNASFSAAKLLDIKRNVIFKSIGVQLRVKHSSTVMDRLTAQLRWEGPLADAGGNALATKPPKALSSDDPVNLKIGIACPYQRRPIDSASTTDVFSVNFDTIGNAADAPFEAYMTITTKVMVMPQVNIADI